MCVVNDAIEDDVGVGGIADQLVPFVDRDLAGDDCRSAAVALFNGQLAGETEPVSAKIPMQSTR